MLRREAEGGAWYLPMEGRNATGEDGTFTFAKSGCGPMGAERSERRGLGVDRVAANGLRRRVGRNRSPPAGRRKRVRDAEVVDDVDGRARRCRRRESSSRLTRAPGDWSRHILTEMTLGRVSAKEVPPGTWKLIVGALGYR